MIYISYGVTKSASTFLYQLTEEVFRSAGREVARLGPPLRSAISVENYFDCIDAAFLERLERGLKWDADIVLKTHGPLHPEVRALIEAGVILANASIRDPREIALSMLDHGVRARTWRRRPFAEYQNVRDTLPALDLQFGRFRDWSAARGVKVFTFNQICFGTPDVVDQLAKQVGVQVDAERIVAKYQDRTLIGQFSKGVAFRYREMSPEDDRLFLARYADLYANISFETQEAKEIAATQRPDAVKPRGGVQQLITLAKRRFRL